jgi:hypothetical protein
MSYFGVSVRNGAGLGLGTVPSLVSTPLSYRLAPALNLEFAGAESLDPRITFTRASTATYFNSAGVLTTTGFNLLLYSEQFDNAAWAKSNSTVTANAITSPDGTADADKLVPNTTSGDHLVSENVGTVVSGTVYTFSVYAKAGGYNFIRLSFGNIAGGGLTFFNLANGTVGTTSGMLSSQIESVGNGWYRCSVVRAASSSAVLGGDVYVTSANNQFNWSGDGTSGIYIWGAQLETGSTATAYIPTVASTSGAPRFDYDPVTLAPKGLLIEESRTNLLLYSTDLSTGWTKGTGATWTANAATAPDGTMTALQGNGISGTVIIATGTTVYRLNNTVSGSTTYTFSVYVRAQTGTVSNVRLRLNETGGNNTISSDFTVTTAWTRISLTVTTAAGATAISTLVGTGTLADLYIWGAQLEAGAFATSYIPTVASQVTRAADVAVMTGTNFSSWYNATEGTLFVQAIEKPDTVTRQFATISDGTTDIYSVATFNNTGRIRAQGASSGGIGTTVTGQSFKIGYSFISGAQAGSLNSSSIVTTSTTVTTTPNQFRIGTNQAGSVFWNSHISRIAYYNRRLTNAELQGITS